MPSGDLRLSWKHAAAPTCALDARVDASAIADATSTTARGSAILLTNFSPSERGVMG
jgi:hypothetical protein